LWSVCINDKMLRSAQHDKGWAGWSRRLSGAV
jgi:hypothetical protein